MLVNSIDTLVTARNSTSTNGEAACFDIRCQCASLLSSSIVSLLTVRQCHPAAASCPETQTNCISSMTEHQRVQQLFQFELGRDPALATCAAPCCLARWTACSQQDKIMGIIEEKTSFEIQCEFASLLPSSKHSLPTERQHHQQIQQILHVQQHKESASAASAACLPILLKTAPSLLIVRIQAWHTRCSLLTYGASGFPEEDAGSQVLMDSSHMSLIMMLLGGQERENSQNAAAFKTFL